jgi:hypothetical protein
MKISGFTFLRNAHKLHYPIRESILSILDLVDEFVIALGKGDPDDTSLAIIESINSSKIKIINTVWDLGKYPDGTEYAHQTDLAKQHCIGDWLFYLQGDEVIHEKDIIEIKQACTENLNNIKVEGFIFNYKHFWGDYDHYFADHCWYKREVRIIRNWPEIHSWRDAQSFRWVENIQNFNYNTSFGNRKLNCKLLKATVYHYGWVRPPELMKKKNDEVIKNYNKEFWELNSNLFDYGRMDFCKIFKESHPTVMKDRLNQIYWKNKLRFKGPITINRTIMKHERPKYRVLSWIEEYILGGKVIGGFKNYKIIR